MAKKNNTNKWGGGGYAAVPHRVLRSKGYANLSPRATKLLSDLLSQYYGTNNGDLCAAVTLMKPRGWKSNSALTKARNELLKTGFIAESRHGGKNIPTLYSITFYSIDECINNKTKLSRHDVNPTSTPVNTWMKFEPSPDLLAAQKRQKAKEAENNILHLKKQIEETPNDRYRAGMEAGIEHWKAKTN